MPTGYTYIIEERDDVTFREFALRCARAFGACIEQRDESIDTPPRERVVDPYYSNCLAEARAELERIRGMSDAEKAAEFAEECARVEACNAAELKRAAEMKERYSRIQREADRWNPPTPDHEELKRFMLQQLSIGSPGEPFLSEAPESAEAFHATRIKEEQDHVAYYEEQVQAETKRASSSNGWIAALKDSLR